MKKLSNTDTGLKKSVAYKKNSVYNSRSQMFFKVGVLKNVAIFIDK